MVIDSSEQTGLVNAMETSEAEQTYTTVDIVMMSGEPACTVDVSEETRVKELRGQIFKATGVPIFEQRLYVGGAGDEMRDEDGLLPTTLFLPKCEEPAKTPYIQLVRSYSDPRNTNLKHFSAKAEVKTLVGDGNFTKVRTLSTALYGEVGLYSQTFLNHASNLVAVKRMPNRDVFQNSSREANDWHAHRYPHDAPKTEDPLTEIAILSYLSEQTDTPLFLQRSLGAFCDGTHTWLVTEFADGGELFVRAQSNDFDVTEEKARNYMWQLLQAVSYLHKHRIGHRDISLENILVHMTDDTLRLMDFGMAVLSHSPTGQEFRYFRKAGKDIYRAPECHVPTLAEIQVTAPAGSTPSSVVSVDYYGALVQVRLPNNVVAGATCTADVWGYAVPPADIFSCGVCLFSLKWGVSPWGSTDMEDTYFNYVHLHGMKALMQHWQMPTMSPEAMTLLYSILSTNPSERPTADECLASPWFQSLASKPVPAHPKLVM